MENNKSTKDENLLMLGVPQEEVTRVIQLLSGAGVRVTIFPRAPLPTFQPLFSGIPGSITPPSYLGVAKASAERPAPPAPPAPPKKKKTPTFRKVEKIPLREFVREHPDQARMIKMGGKDLDISSQPLLHALIQKTIKEKTGDENSYYGLFIHRNYHKGWWGFVGFKSAEAADDFEHYCQNMTFFHEHVRLDMHVEPYEISEEEDEEDGGMIEE